MPAQKPNIKQAVPFFFVRNMEESLKFYLEGLGFELKNKWTPSGEIEWCWIERDHAALMLQEWRPERISTGIKGEGVSICFTCEDALALYHEFLKNGIKVSEPFVGNNLWDVGLVDPDGYQLHFESPTDVPEETKYSEWEMGSHRLHGFTQK
jgi:uncharacterized glyoxalase superfamily protein PhnB